MLTVAPPDAVELKSNAIFDALMWAMSRPGDVRSLPDADRTGLVATLIDLECSAYAEDAGLREAITASGAMLVDDVARADFVFLETLSGAEAKLARLNCGSSLYPDEGATLVVPAAVGHGTLLRLTGPGINGHKDIALDIPAAFWAWREGAALYPEGFDLIIVDGDQTVAVPRSTSVEVL